MMLLLVTSDAVDPDTTMPHVPPHGTSSVLRDTTNRVTPSPTGFNRDLAKTTLLKNTNKIGATATKLLETLSSIKTDASKSTGLKIGGARRVAVANTSLPVAHIAAAPLASPIASTSSSIVKHASEWEQEKAILVAQILKLESERSASSTNTDASWQQEKEQLESACIATQEALESTRSAAAVLEQQLAAAEQSNLDLNTQVVALQAQLHSANTTIAQLQQEKREYESQANADTDVPRSSANSSVESEESEIVMKQHVDVAPAVEVATTAVIEEPVESLNTSAVAPASPVVQQSESALVEAASSPVALPAVFSPLKSEELAAPIPSAVDVDDDFAPVTMEDMEASLSNGAGDDFLNVTEAEANESAASLNLSSTSATGMSPQHHQLPESFLSPQDPTASSTLSPIVRMSSPPANSLTSSSVPALSASALKIQALFRGRMERGYLAQESRLSSLPLTSPSTPTPNAKRQRKSNSPLSMNHSVVAEEGDMMDESTDPPRALSFAMDDDDVQTTAAASSSSSASAASPTAVILAPSLSEIKRFQSEFKAARAPLISLDACWTIRSKAMNRVEELCRERGVQGFSTWTAAMGVTGWKEELAHLQRPVGVQLSDLRSSILREACRLLISMAEASTKDFEEQLGFYLPILFKSLYVTIKVISTTADETIVELVSRVATFKTIPLLLSGLSDTHSVVREKVGVYLTHVLSVSKSSDLESSLVSLTNGLKVALVDSDSKTRAAWRGVFELLNKSFSSQMQTLFDSLPTSVQKAIESDRKAKATAKSTSHKRSRSHKK